MLTYPLIRCIDPGFPNGLLHSPFVIALRNRSVGDRELLEWLGCADYEPQPPSPTTRHQLYLSEDAEWILVADNWSYGLFFRCGEDLLARGARWGELFAFCVGDADESYSFSHYVDGSRRRAYAVDSPHWSDRIVSLDEGTPLQAESDSLRMEEAMLIVWTLAASLGIETDHRRKTFRCYGPAVDDGLGG